MGCNVSISTEARANGMPAAMARSQNPASNVVSFLPASPASVTHAASLGNWISSMPALYSTALVALLARRHRGQRLLVFVAGEFVEHALEILGLAEIAVDRGKPHIGDIVELAQVGHHGLADGLRGDLILTQVLQVADNFGYGLLDEIGVDVALAHRNLDRTGKLVAVERHTPAIALDHHQPAQLDAFKSGETGAAGQAKPAATDRRGVLGRPRILDLRIEAAATRTAHPLPHRLWSRPRGRDVSGIVDWKPCDQPGNLLARRPLGDSIGVGALVRKGIEHVRDQIADLAEFGEAEPAGGPGRRAEPDARSD